MSSLLIALLSFAGYIAAYRFYGRFIGSKIFKLNSANIAPSVELHDKKDFVPTSREILFGHHFTSIAGLGPIVGPAIAIIWGWLPAVLWVVFGSILMGGVHDLGSLILSMRHKGGSLGDVASVLISPRVRNIVLIIMFLTNLMVMAVFTLIVAILFNMYPSAVIPIWMEVPVALLLGYIIYKKNASPMVWSIGALVLLYALIIVGVHFPVQMPEFIGLNPLVIWAVILLVYAYVASILPVTTLLQPRDYINGHQLFAALILLLAGVFALNPEMAAPVVDTAPDGAPAMFPFLFLVIACGAISGFHTLVSGGTTSKQCSSETDALSIGYGGMLLEGALAILVIIAVGAGIGLGFTTGSGDFLTGSNAFSAHYSSWASASGLGAKLKAFVEGSANLMSGYGIPNNISVTIMGVFIVSFAATTLDSSARIQRYIVSEFAKFNRNKFFTRTHPATLIAIGVTALVCFHGGFTESALRKGALALWPLFGVTNQLLAALALFVITVYLHKKSIPVVITLLPAMFMTVITVWGAVYNIETFFNSGNLLLFFISLISLLIQVWIVYEAVLILKKKNSFLQEM